MAWHGRLSHCLVPIRPASTLRPGLVFGLDWGFSALSPRFCTRLHNSGFNKSGVQEPTLALLQFFYALLKSSAIVSA